MKRTGMSAQSCKPREEIRILTKPRRASNKSDLQESFHMSIEKHPNMQIAAHKKMYSGKVSRVNIFTYDETNRVLINNILAI